MTEPDEQPFTPSLTEARMPSVDHMFNQGMLNVILDRWTGTKPGTVPTGRPELGLFNNLVRLVDKALREYDAARFELIDYLAGRDSDQRAPGVRTSPYIRAIDHMENLISALARGLSARERLQALGIGREAPRISPTICDDVVRLRDMIEHADDRLTKSTSKPSRQPFKDEEPYALRLENDWAWLGNWKIDYADIVTAITCLYQFIETVRGIASAGANHPQSVTRTTVTTVGTPPVQAQGALSGSDYLWELSRQSVSH